jgi:hypothetical protein
MLTGSKSPFTGLLHSGTCGMDLLYECGHLLATATGHVRSSKSPLKQQLIYDLGPVDVPFDVIETPPAKLCSKPVSGAEKASIPATVSTQPEGETVVLRRGLMEEISKGSTHAGSKPAIG